VTVDAGVDVDLAAIGYDPQTSGGLLAAVDPAVVADLTAAGFVPIGRVVDGAPGLTVV
jgi:hypothetical protein